MLGKVEICGVNTSRLQTLSNEEMMRLIELAQKGDQAAKQRLVEGNLKLVLSVIQRFLGRGENPDDLFQVGCIGLIKAIDNFDLKQQVRFSTYAVPMIIGEIRRYLRDNSMIRVSRSQRDLAYRALRVKEELSLRLSRDPTDAEIAAEIEAEPAAVTEALTSITTPLSLYEPVFSEGGDALYLMDQISDDKENDETWIDNIAIGEAMKRLSDRERSIISMRFFRGKTQMEIADEIGISQAQVSRIEKGALDRIRRQI